MKRHQHKHWRLRFRPSGRRRSVVVRYQPPILPEHGLRCYDTCNHLIGRLTPETVNRLRETLRREVNQLARLAGRTQRVETRNAILEDRPEEAPADVPDERTFAIDAGGNLWHWNAGWFRSDNLGNPLPGAKRIGHLVFRRHVQLLDLRKRKNREVLLGVDRPGMLWRRWVGGVRYQHQMFGNVKVLASDGIHAVIETPEDGRQTVMYGNLTELKPPPEPRRPRKTGPKKKAAKSAKALSQKYAALAAGLE